MYVCLHPIDVKQIWCGDLDRLGLTTTKSPWSITAIQLVRCVATDDAVIIPTYVLWCVINNSGCDQMVNIYIQHCTLSSCSISSKKHSPCGLDIFRGVIEVSLYKYLKIRHSRYSMTIWESRMTENLCSTCSIYNQECNIPGDIPLTCFLVGIGACTRGAGVWSTFWFLYWVIFKHKCYMKKLITIIVLINMEYVYLSSSSLGWNLTPLDCIP